MNILAWLLYLKTLVFLVQPITSMGMRLCGIQIPQMMAIVCEGRGYYAEGSTDSPLLTESQAKTFTKGGRKRTGRIVTECCHNPCEMELIETYCAPLQKGQIKYTDRNLDFVNEANNIVEEPPAPQQVEENEFVEETNQYVSQDITVDTTSDEFAWGSESGQPNVLNNVGMMLGDQARDDASENDEEHIAKDKSLNKQVNITVSQTDEMLDNEDTDSENSESKLSSTTKGNTRTKPTHRPTSRNSRRKTSREKKKNKTKTRSKERKGRRRGKPKKNKNRHDRRRKGKRHGGDRDDSTQPTDEFITDIEVPLAKVQAIAGIPSSRSEPANIDDPTDPGTRSERSFVTTIHARLVDFLGSPQQNNNRKRR